MIRKSPGQISAALRKLKRSYSSGEAPAELLSSVQSLLTDPALPISLRDEVRLLHAEIQIAMGNAAAALKDLVPLSRGRRRSAGDRARLSLRMGQACAGLGRLSQARQYLAAASRRFKALAMKRDAASADAESAAVLRKLGRPVEAVEVYTSLLRLYPAAAGANAAGIRINLANALGDAGRFADSLAQLEAARAIFKKFGILQGEAFCVHASGAVRLALGLFREAEEDFRFAEAGFRSAGDRKSELHARENRGMSLAAIGCQEGIIALRDVRRRYRQSGAVLDALRSLANILYFHPTKSEIDLAESAWGEAKYFGSGRESAALACAMGLALSPQDPRFTTWVERASSSARRSGSSLRKAEAEMLAALVGAPGRKPARLQRAISLLAEWHHDPTWSVLPWTGGLGQRFWSRLMAEVFATNDAQLVRTLLRQARSLAVDASDATWRRSCQFRGRRDQPGGAGVASAGSTAIEVHLDSDGSLGILAEAGGRTKVVFSRSTRLVARLDEFDEEIALAEADAEVRYDPERIRSISRLMNQIREEVLVPLPEIYNSAEQVSIFPSGLAWRIPFRALLPAETDARIVTETATQGLIRHAPACSRLHPRCVIVLGNIIGLADAESEARCVARRTEGRILRGRMATPKRVMSAFCNADLFYFIGHAQSRPENPSLSCLELGSGRFLFAWDLAACRTKKWPRVVLSTCSAGDAHGGLGLAPSFLLAGAGEVVASRWRVADATAKGQWNRLIEGNLPRSGHGHPWWWAGWERWVSSGGSG